MKNLCVVLAVYLAPMNSIAQMSADSIAVEQTLAVNEPKPERQMVVPTDDEILKMNIFDACKALGVNPVYNKRYEDIILPLCEAGVIMFTADGNPYADDNDQKSLGWLDPKSGRYVAKDESGKLLYLDCYYYIGTGAQNATLIRNMVANKHLIKNGKLVPGAAKRWKVVK